MMATTISKQMIHRATKIAKDYGEDVVVFLHDGQIMTALVSCYERSSSKDNFEKLAVIDEHGDFVD